AADSTTVQYGWRTKKMDTQEVLLQNGKIEGLSVDMRYYPKDAYTVIVLSNCFDGRAIEMANRVEKVLYDESFVVAAHPLGFFLNEIIKESGVEFVSNNINNILKTNGYELEKVWTLYSLGYDLMDAGKMDEAGEIFKINVSKFPQEPMAYDSLGAYYDKVDENRLALQNFERKLQLSPGDKRAKSMITYLKAEIAKE
ncbi:MAG: tetratricopeptide repeat protein, partial [Chitinophagales bacterium]